MKKLLLMCALLFSSMAGAAEGTTPVYGAGFLDLEGRPVSLSYLEGKVAVVAFWASWCPPCIEEIPVLAAAYAKYREQGVEFVALTVEDDAALVKEFAQKHGMSYPLLLGKDESIQLMKKLGNWVAWLPYTLVLDAQGNLVTKRRGAMDAARLDQAVQAALSTRADKE